MADAEKELRAMIANLAEKTGKPLEAWVKLAKASGEEKHGRMVAHLKSEHGLGHGYANLVAHMHLKTGSINASSEDDLVAAQYAGTKAALRPWYDRLHKAIGAFGKDVEFAPKKAYVSLRRRKQFALLQPSTADRLDVGINLKGVPPAGRLEASGSFNAMVSHRVRVAKAADIDAQLIGWLRAAYDQA